MRVKKIKSEIKHRNRSSQTVRKSKTEETLHTRYKTIPDVNLQTLPVINLQGLWLEDAGFWCGDRVKIEVRHRCIIIRPEKRIPKE